MTSLYRRLVGFGFRLLYNEMAWTYDTVSQVVSLGDWGAWGRAALRHLNAVPGTHVLELAHGTGTLQAALRTLGYRSVGVDLSPAMGRIATRKLRRAAITPTLVNGSAMALPFASDSFDGIVCIFPTNFITDPATIREAWRVLKPGARLVIVPNATFTGRSAATQSLDVLYRATGQGSVSQPDVDAMERAISGWSRYFEPAGFTVMVRLEPCRRSAALVVIAQKAAT